MEALLLAIIPLLPSLTLDVVTAVKTIIDAFASGSEPPAAEMQLAQSALSAARAQADAATQAMLNAKPPEQLAD